MLFHPPTHVLLIFITIRAIVGFTLAIVFQLAHVADDNTFAAKATETINSEWAVHQVETTSNFSREGKLAQWYTGGLNFQIEHHLFPRICHIHYSSISEIVRKTCTDYGVSYISYPTFCEGVTAHHRFLKQLGQQNS